MTNGIDFDDLSFSLKKFRKNQEAKTGNKSKKPHNILSFPIKNTEFDPLAPSPSIDLALLSVFYFTDEFSALAVELDEEIRHALVIMVYRYLIDAQEHGDLELNDRGFTLATDAADDLRKKIENAIITQKIEFDN